LTLAVAHHRAGRIADAERIYRRVLEADPEQPDALHLLGVIAASRQELGEAIALLTRAIAAAPDSAACHNALGTAQRAAGAIEEAIRSYRRALTLDPRRAELATNLAAALLEQGDLEEAARTIEQALDLDPDYVDAHFVQGDLHRARRDNLAAERSYRRVLGAGALAGPALFNLANTLRDQGRLAEAAAHYRDLLHLEPRHLGAKFALGCTLQAQGSLDVAAACFHDVVEQSPGHREAHFHLGVVWQARGELEAAVRSYGEALRLGLDRAELHTNLGVALQRLGCLAQAEACQRRAIALDPSAPDLKLNLASVLQESGRYAEAAEECRAAVRVRSELAEAHAMLGLALGALEDDAGAVSAHRRATALRPTSPAVLNECANALMDAGETEAAIETYRAAVALEPELAETRYNLGLALLATGRLDEGWALYRWRNRLPSVAARPAWRQPEWTGEPLGGTLLVWREQGLGDELMLGSCLPDLAGRVSRLVVAGTPRLRALLGRSLPEATIVDAADAAALPADAYDRQIALGDLPGILRRSPVAFPPRRSWLVADPARVAAWRARLAAIGSGPSVGICWRSGLLTPMRRLSYAALDDWRSVLQVPGVRFVNLQYDDCHAELAAVERELGVRIHRWPEVDLMNDLEEAAALTAALDLVVSAPTAVGELAGALGVPVWRVIAGRDWTMLGTGRRPWFPSMEVQARRRGTGWAAHLAAVADALARFTASHRGGA
jgi:tetratricopeptide (TPR) repeat protein